MMKKRFFCSLLLALCILPVAYAQQPDPETALKLSRVEKIYRNLEYNTTAFNDLKRTWIATDPVFVREIYNRFIVKNALRLNGRKPSMAELEAKSMDIYAGNVFIDLRKRYYDDEIELLRFFTESRYGQDSSDFFFDPVTDYVNIQEILGRELYQDLKKRFYSINDVTKTFYDSKYAYNFDIYLHLQNPELMFWSLTTESRNKYLVSVIGRWGNDHLALPGWYYPSYVAGFKVGYMEYLVNNKPATTYVGEIGVGLPAKQPRVGIESDDVGRRLFYTGTPFYFKFTGSPLGYIWEDIADIEVNVSGMFTMTQLGSKEIGLNYLTKFYSTRNYLDIFFRKKGFLNFQDIGVMYAGLGYNTYDVRYYALNPDISKLVDLDAGGSRFRNNMVAEVGFEGEGGLLTHYLSAMASYNMSESNGYLGVKLYLMLTNTIGFDFKFLTGYRFSRAGLPFYRSDNYLVFSPVIKINY